MSKANVYSVYVSGRGWVRMKCAIDKEGNEVCIEELN